MLRGIFGEGGFGRELRGAPVEEAPMVGTGRHAHAAANAAALVNEDNALFGVVGCRHRADIDAGGILAVEARCGHEVGAATGEVYEVDLNPLLPLRDKMPYGTCLRALWRRSNGYTPLALLQVDDHAPGMNLFLR